MSRIVSELVDSADEGKANLSERFFFFNDTATTEIYTLSLHDALPICTCAWRAPSSTGCRPCSSKTGDRKSTRLNSSHLVISYAVFCLKKKHHSRKQSRTVDARSGIAGGKADRPPRAI